MEWERIKANWPHFKVLARVRWRLISAEEFELIDGRREALARQIAEVYRVSQGMAQMQLESWQGQQREPGTA